MSLILSGTDGLSDVDGSASTPAIRGTDTNTGIFFPAADTIAFAEGGAEVARFDSSGNLGIGTSSGAYSTGGGLTVYNATAGIIKVGSASSGVGASDGVELIYGTEAYLWNRENTSLIFGTNATSVGEFTSTGNFRFNSGYGSVATAYGCRAWVNFNGTGTVAIRASGNVSSVSDDGTGTYTINFTTALTDANYNVISSGPPNNTSTVGGLGFVVRNSSPSGSPSNKTTTQVQMMYAGTGSLVDASELYASVYR